VDDRKRYSVVERHVNFGRGKWRRLMSICWCGYACEIVDFDAEAMRESEKLAQAFFLIIWLYIKDSIYKKK